MVQKSITLRVFIFFAVQSAILTFSFYISVFVWLYILQTAHHFVAGTLSPLRENKANFSSSRFLFIAAALYFLYISLKWYHGIIHYVTKSRLFKQWCVDVFYPQYIERAEDRYWFAVSRTLQNVGNEQVTRSFGWSFISDKICCSLWLSLNIFFPEITHWLFYFS